MGNGPLHPVRLDLHGPNHVAIDLEGEFDRVDGVEQSFLVLLQVFVIRQGQAFQGCHQGDHFAIDASRLAAYQLRNVGILFLGHHGRTRGKSVVQLDKAEFRAAPEAQFLRQAAHVHHQYRGKRKEIQHIIPVADRIHAVCIHIFKI